MLTIKLHARVRLLTWVLTLWVFTQVLTLKQQVILHFADLNDIARLGLNVRISVAGGIKASTVQDVVRAGANIIVVGAAIYGAASPAEAAREIRELVDAV